MQLVYIAGPYRAATAWDVEKNVRAAEELAHAVWRLGAVAICPHAMARWMSDVPEENYLEGFIDLLRRCDALITVRDWRESRGAMDEVAVAREIKIPVFFDLVEVVEWLKKL
jgi:hypothetical protein